MFKITENEIEYIVNDNNTAVLFSATNYTGKELKVPDCIENDIPVISISEKAFYRNEYIRCIVLPSSVGNIGEYAFAWCTELESVTITGVRTICSRAFMGCGKLRKIEIFSSLKRIEDKAFSYCSSIKSVTIPDSVTYIGESVFEGCRNLEVAVLPRRLDILSNGIFYACVSLRSVTMPSSLSYIDEYAFAYCTSLDLPYIPATAVLNNSAFHECGDLRKKYIAS